MPCRVLGNWRYQDGPLPTLVNLVLSVEIGILLPTNLKRISPFYTPSSLLSTTLLFLPGSPSGRLPPKSAGNHAHHRPDNNDGTNLFAPFGSHHHGNDQSLDQTRLSPSSSPSTASIESAAAIGVAPPATAVVLHLSSTGQLLIPLSRHLQLQLHLQRQTSTFNLIPLNIVLFAQQFTSFRVCLWHELDTIVSFDGACIFVAN